jgi:hypothetical protein
MTQLVITLKDQSYLPNIRRIVKSLVGVEKVTTTKNADTRKPRLYDPETGECLNDKTMKAIEDVRSGKDKGTTYASYEDFEKAMRAL